MSNAADMLGVVRARLGDPGKTTWKDAALYAYLTEAQRHLANELCDAGLWPLCARATITIIAEQTNYDLPADFLRERLVKYKTRFARRWSLADEDSLRDNPQTAPSETNPFYYVWNGDLQFPRITPTQAGGETIDLWYLAAPGPISAVSEPILPKPYFNTMETWAVARALEQNEQFEVADVEMAHVVEETILYNSRYSGKPAYDGVPNDPRLEVLRSR